MVRTGPWGTSEGGDQSSPAPAVFSRDSKSLAFSRSQETYVFDIGSTEAVLAWDVYCRQTVSDFSPDGESLLISASQAPSAPDLARHVYELDLRTGDAELVSTDEDGNPIAHQDEPWIPIGGSQLAVNTHARGFTPNGDVVFTTWSPDQDWDDRTFIKYLTSGELVEVGKQTVLSPGREFAATTSLGTSDLLLIVDTSDGSTRSITIPGLGSLGFNDWTSPGVDATGRWVRLAGNSILDTNDYSRRSLGRPIFVSAGEAILTVNAGEFAYVSLP